MTKREMMMNKKIEETKVDTEKLLKLNVKRSVPQKEPDPVQSPTPVSAGPLDRVIDYAFNPAKDKSREVTIIDRMQGRLLPSLDLINTMWQYALEIATYRQDMERYEETYKREQPVPPNLMDEYIYRVAQWQKSVAGMNLKSLMDLALAEIETRSDEEQGEGFGKDAWAE